MLQHICRILILSLFTVLWSSYGQCMDPPEVPHEAPGTKKKQQKTISLPRKEWPRHFNLLIVQFGGKREVRAIPKNERLSGEREEYQSAFKYYMRALTAHNQNPQDVPLAQALQAQKKNFNAIQRKALCKHATAAVIEKVKQIPEGTDLSIEFRNEIEDIEVLMFPFKFTTYPYDSKILEKRPDGEVGQKRTKQTVPCYYLDPEELNLATEQLENFLFFLERGHNIQKSIWVSYCKYYFLENKSWTSFQQWGNYLFDSKRELTLEAIQKHIEEKYPYGEYKLQLIPGKPTPERLSCIGPRTLGTYARENKFYYKIKDQEEILIPLHHESCKLGLKPKIAKRLLVALTTEEESTISIEDQWQLLHFAALINYLPRNCSSEQMSRKKQERKKVLCILKNKPIVNWEWAVDQWKKQLKDQQGPFQAKATATATEEDIQGKDLESLNRAYNQLPKEGSETSPPKDWEMVEQGWNTLQYQPKSGWDKKREEWERQTFNYKMQNGAYRAVPHKFVYSQRKKVLSVLLELHKEQKPQSTQQLPLKEELTLKEEDFKKYPKKAFEKYKKSYIKLEKFLNVDNDQQFVMNQPSSKYSFIPVCGEFYQSEFYAKQHPLQEIHLSHCKLSENSFFYKNESNFSQEKKRKGNSLLSNYSIIHLDHNKLKALSEQRFSANLQELYIHRNSLIKIDTFQKLANLTVLNISFNQMSNLCFIKDCTSLTFLNFSNNAIGSVSSSFDQLRYFSLLTNLKTLDISHNQVDTLTPLKPLTSLTSLNASCNKLTGESKDALPFGLPLRFFNIKENPQLTFTSSSSLNETFKICFRDLQNLETDKGNFTWR